MAAGGLALAIVFWAEHVAGLAPCELCLIERWPYRVLVLLGMLQVGCSLGRVEADRPLGLLVTTTLLVSTIIAMLHVGIEQHWWPNPFPACTAPRFHGGSFAERLASMPSRPAKPCDAPNRLFGWLPVSMTTLDLLYATILLLASRMPIQRFLRPARSEGTDIRRSSP